MIYLFSFLKSLEFFGAVAVPFYLQRMEFSYTQMFLMETIFSVCLFLFEIPTGVVADRWGRKT
jgi:MFS family permease